MIRLFAALAVPPDIGRGLQTRQVGIEGARWRPLENLHVMLRFLGEVRQDIARDLDAELLAIGGQPFEITLEGVGTFQDGPDIHAVWAGVGGSPQLARLAGACEAAARRVGLKPDKRRFRPHVTLAYLRHANPAEVAAWIQDNNLLTSPPMRVEALALYSSVLGKEGSRYRIEAEYPLI